MPGTTPFDSQLFGALYRPSDLEALWSDQGLVESWLRVEVALAEVQAELSIVPPEAVNAIRAVANVERVDFDALAKGTTQTGMPIKPLIDQMGALGGPLVAQYLHWGATTQDILDTSLALRLRDTLDRVDARCRALLEIFATLAETHRHTVMVARTNSQDAAPTTFGLHVSSYATELVRHRTRLCEMRPRVATGVFGGAVGTLASSGPQGLEVRDRWMARLGLSGPQGLMNASLDHVAEFVLGLGLVHGTLTRFANDVETLGRTAVGEVREGEGPGASSTMPHKTNPRAANAIRTLGRMGFSLSGAAYHLLDQVEVRSAAMRSVSWSVVPEACMTAAMALDRAIGLARHLHVDGARMRANFDHAKGYVLSESVMMRLAAKVGRARGYAMVRDALAAAPHDASLLEALLADAAVRSHLAESEIVEACAPEGYLGQANALLDEALVAIRASLSA
ncbi:MAG: adenylosuccinate lyase family protein [Myxococcota bacterium]